MSESDFLFVIPLGIGLVATFVATRFSDDLTYLGIAIAIASGLFSLVLAPWEIQVLLLGLILFVAKQLRRQLAQPRSEKSDSDRTQTTASPTFDRQKTEKTTWKYRGVSYDRPEPSAPSEPQEIGGTYRGKPWKAQNQQATTGDPSPHTTLKYRGIPWTPQSDRTAKDRSAASDRSS